MKKLVILLTLFGTVSVSFGQAYVSFFNASGSRVSTNSLEGPTGGTGPGLLAGGPIGSFYYELLVASSTQNTITAAGNPLMSGWTDTGVMGTNTLIAGHMAGFTSTDQVGAEIPGYVPGEIADFAVVGWSANLGTSFVNVMSWWNNGNPLLTLGTVYNFGISAVADDIYLEPAPGPYMPVWGNSSIGLIQGMTLGSYSVPEPIVPEPGTMALSGIGGIALLMLRRRK